MSRGHTPRSGVLGPPRATLSGALTSGSLRPPAHSAKDGWPVHLARVSRQAGVPNAPAQASMQRGRRGLPGPQRRGITGDKWRGADARALMR